MHSKSFAELSERKEKREIALGLREEGVSERSIAKRIGLKRSNIRTWFHGSNPYGSYNQPDLSPSPELSYVIGVIKGDGSLYHDGKKSYLVRLAVTDYDFALEFSNCLNKVLNKQYSPHNRPPRKINWKETWNVRARSRLLYEFLSQSLVELNDIVKCYPEQFIRGIFDSEGCVSMHPNSHGGKYHPEVFISNTDMELLEYTCSLLTSCGIKCSDNLRGGRVRRVERKPCYSLFLRSQVDIEAFCYKIGFSIKRKQDKLVGKFGEKKTITLDYETKRFITVSIIALERENKRVRELGEREATWRA